MSKFTPGPWSISEPQIRGDYVMPGYVWINGRDWYALAQVCVLDGDVISETGLANARLIAAAPEMYEALRRIREGCAFPADDVQRAIRDVARAILAKIDGDEE